MTSGVYETFTRLEPNHDVRVEDGLFIVLCPFEQTADGQIVLHDHPVTETASWSESASADEVDCPVCEVFNGALHFAGPAAHDHQGEDDPDADPPVAGGAHGGVHHVSEYGPCRIPLRRVELVRGVWITVHEGALPSLSRVRQAYEAADGYRRYPIRQRDTAAYVCRKTVSGSSWSKHAYGSAVDVNWQTNPYGRTLRTDMPGWFVAIWTKEGWGWGGNWRSVKDAMHFSKFPNEGGDGRLYVGREVAREEDDLAQVPQKEWEAVKAMAEASYKALHKKAGGVTHEHLNIVENMLRAVGAKLGVEFGDDGTVK